MESGLGLTAACLPTLYSLFKQTIQSLTSESKSRLRSNSMSSERHIVPAPAGVNTTASIALKDINEASERGQPEIGQILVKKTLERSEEMVWIEEQTCQKSGQRLYHHSNNFMDNMTIKNPETRVLLFYISIAHHPTSKQVCCILISLASWSKVLFQP